MLRVVYANGVPLTVTWNGISAQMAMAVVVEHIDKT